MADKGAYGTKGCLSQNFSRGNNDQLGVGRKVVIGRQVLIMGASKDVSQGNPSQPCLKMTRPEKFCFYWSVDSGTSSISIDVKYTPNSTPRPRLIVKANAEVGVDADVVGVAAAGAGWVTIGPVEITTDSAGVVKVELDARYYGTEGEAVWTLWDNILIDDHRICLFDDWFKGAPFIDILYPTGLLGNPGMSALSV